ncbi:hypothetical protein [Nocardioides ungokensis]|uniref:hypothetical protein n=1 Tax=Nocardioides ungokensis TaxID=1643322 RepID=UPI0015E01E55|nr:hypothetical protein [Nocardioides ungokensis]
MRDPRRDGRGPGLARAGGGDRGRGRQAPHRPRGAGGWGGVPPRCRDPPERDRPGQGREHLVEVADPDAAERKTEKELDRQDRAAHHHRFLAIVEDGRRRRHPAPRPRHRRGRAAIKAALLPLTKPQPASTRTRTATSDRPRDHGARLWDALVETCRHALTTDLPPDCHGARPRIAVTTSLEALQQKIDWATLGTTGQRSPTTGWS